MALEAKITRQDANRSGHGKASVRLYEPKGTVRAGTKVRLIASTFSEDGSALYHHDTGMVETTRPLPLYEFAKLAAESLSLWLDVESVPRQNSPTLCHIDLSPQLNAERIIVSGAKTE